MDHREEPADGERDSLYDAVRDAACLAKLVGRRPAPTGSIFAIRAHH
jgi:hypothetical protein